jgi:hypothetical protein
MLPKYIAAAAQRPRSTSKSVSLSTTRTQDIAQVSCFSAAGSGGYAFRDGDGEEACFAAPRGICVLPHDAYALDVSKSNGHLQQLQQQQLQDTFIYYVCEANNVIRAIKATVKQEIACAATATTTATESDSHDDSSLSDTKQDEDETDVSKFIAPIQDPFYTHSVSTCVGQVGVSRRRKAKHRHSGPGLGPDVPPHHLRLGNPTDVSVTLEGKFAVLYVTDRFHGDICRIQLDNSLLAASQVSVIPLQEDAEPIGICAMRSSPYVYFTDQNNSLCRVRTDGSVVADTCSLFNEEKKSASTAAVDVIIPAVSYNDSQCSKDGHVSDGAHLCKPLGLCASPDESKLYIADLSCVRCFDIQAGMLSTIAGHPSELGFADGDATSVARFHRTGFVAIDEFNPRWLYVPDFCNHVIRRVDLVSSIVETVTGIPTQFGSVDGPQGVTKLHNPTAVALDARRGFLMVTEASVNDIRRITVPNTQPIWTMVLMISRARSRHHPVLDIPMVNSFTANRLFDRNVLGIVSSFLL